MKFGFVLPFGSARMAVSAAMAAEAAGWEGFFMSEPVWGIDPWVSLAAVAMATQKIRLGTMLSPLPILKPWKLAGETATLDNLSGGRVILSVGLGAVETGFARFGEETDRGIRAERLDEGLDILTGLWRGQPFAYSGRQYHLQATDFMPPEAPIQKPRIPIWVVGAWGFRRSMERALKWDGWIPTQKDPDGRWVRASVETIRDIRTYALVNRPAGEPLDVVQEGETPGDDQERARAILSPWAEAGVTWWTETMWGTDDFSLVMQRIQQGPPGMA
jgi:alkanesulfonate monooxygenase SsuD/methylene tetrahydromethanopterin reductase-like flavin-dependent oxidoreductase (luciferase family)